MDDYRITRLAVLRGADPGEDRVEVACANGLTGAGQGSWGEAALARSPEMLLGRTPFEAEAVWEDMAAAGAGAGGLDIALWDLAGKAVCLPAARVLGKTWRDVVPVCGPGEAPEFLEPQGDAARFRALRETTIVPVAAGRACGFAELLALVQHKLIDIAIAPLARCGLTGVRRLAYYCWLYRVRGAVACSDAEISLAAALAGSAGFVPVTSAMAAPQPFVLVPSAGRVMAVPCAPGLGTAAPPLTAPDYVLEATR
jgi:L-alanine-DL-glutamate epimerase-like enolase superfamily enzyme